MTEQELEQKISEIERTEADPQERARRIAFVRETYESQVRDQQERAERARQLAEASMRDELRRAFMRNPAATENDFEELYPELRRRKLMDDALRGGSDEVSPDALAYYKGAFSGRRDKARA
jgi:hypothetical protein